MANTHTPGPWTIDHARIGPLGESVALLCDPGAPKGDTVIDWPWTYDEPPPSSFEEAEANAHLLASAPMMLEALEAIRPDFDLLPPRVAAIANDAIAKAKGGTE